MKSDQKYFKTAMDSVKEAHELVKNDPSRPRYHLLPPAMWMNDPNGPIFYNNKYHLFYQHNPFKPKWGVMFWGHAVSSDLINWTHKPIALIPDREKGEKYCFSGCCVDNNGIPTIIYTSIKSLGVGVVFGAETWKAISDSDLLNWRRSSSNPVLDISIHKREGVRQMRDPYVWKERDTWHLILGGQLVRPKRGAIFHYTSSDLESWKYEGRLYEGNPKIHKKPWECPNLLKFGEKSVILISPFSNVQFAIDKGTQDELKWYVFDHSHEKTFYAPNSIRNPENEEEYILWGWIRGGGLHKLWNGCFSIPRILKLENENLIVKPSPKLQTLRSNHRQFTNQPVITNFHDVCGELVLKISKNQQTTIDLYTNTEDKYQIVHDPRANTIKMGKQIANLQFPDEETILHLFIDRSVIELFINYRECFTARFYPYSYKDLTVDCHGADFESVDFWDIKPIT